MLDFQRKWCVKIFDDLKEFEMFKMFNTTNMNTDGNDSNQAALARVKASFDAVQQKLDSGEYKAVGDWVKDVNLIFFNIKSSSKKGTPTYMAADYLEKWFTKKTLTYPSTKEEEWMMKFRKVQTKIQEIVDLNVNC